jgi:hypothetical protein
LETHRFGTLPAARNVGLAVAFAVLVLACVFEAYRFAQAISP